MRNLLLFGLIAVVFSLGLSHSSYATCMDIGNTGTGGNIIDCPVPITPFPIGFASVPGTTINGDEIIIPVNGGVSVINPGFPAIHTLAGGDVVTSSGNIISSTDHGLRTGPDNSIPDDSDTVTINDGRVEGALAGVFTGPGPDIVRVNGGDIMGGTFGITTRQGSDLVEIFGGTITGATLAIQTISAQDTLRIFGGTIDGGIGMGTGADILLIAGGTFLNNSINMGDNNANGDIVSLATDVQLGQIDCGPGINDEIRFSMGVPLALVPAVEAAIAAANPAGDSIMINGITYSWINCEILQSNINGTITIVTLSPLFEINELDTDHTVTATVTTNGLPVVGAEVDFEVTEGPNAGLNSNTDGRCSNPICATDANGEVSWIYVGTLEAGVGTDTIVATYSAQGVDNISNAVEKQWIFAAKDVPTLSEWGLIAMASILGIVGFMVIRRRQVAA